MLHIDGLFSKATVMTDTAEQYALDQLQMICDRPCFSTTPMSIVAMPDIHPGKVGPVGLTIMQLHDSINAKIMPALIGPDIGCGVSVFEVSCKKKDMNLDRLDKVINECIPSGFKHRDASKANPINQDLLDMFWFYGNEEYIEKEMKENMGTLGGGNHFIELDKDDSDKIYLTIHTGSRHIGMLTYNKFMNEANCDSGIPYELKYVKDHLAGLYFHATKACMAFARANRMCIAKTIAAKMKWDCNPIIDSFHNYLTVTNIDDQQYMILRKGACSADLGERVVIPINMKDGIILGTGKGNINWNYSAPHGSGRTIMRSEVKNNHTVSEYKKVMKGIHSACISADTLDEAPFAYHDTDYLLPLISETVTVDKVIKPIYNFKAGGE